MRSVTIREFQAKASQFLSDLPVLLTRNGMPVAKVVAVSYEIKDVTQDVYNNVNTVAPVGVKPPTDVKCEAPFCKNLAVGVGRMFDEASGDMRDIQLCAPHLKRSLKES